MTSNRDMRGGGLEGLARPAYARAVRSAVLLVMGGYATVIGLSVTLARSGPLDHAAEAAVLLVCLFALWQTRHDRVGLAAGLVVGVLALELHWAIVSAGTLRSTALLAFPGLVAGTGLMMGGGWGLRLAGLLVVSAPASASLGRTLGIAARAGGFRDDLSVLVTLAPTVLVTAGVVHLALSALGAARRTASRNEEETREIGTREAGTEGGRAADPADVGARSEAERREGQFGLILEEALNEIFVIDPEGPTVVLASRGARENLGYTDVDLGGVPPMAVNPALTMTRLQRIQQWVTDGEEAVLASRGIHRRRDGSVYPVETRIQSARLAGREVLVVFALDISERVQAEEEQRRLHQQLEHAQRMEAVGRLAGGVAHDFNNLLTIVGGCAEILAEDGEPMTRELAWEILKAQERGAALTRQLLAFARREVAQPTVIDLQRMLSETRPLLERLLGEQIELVTRADGAPRIVADRGQLEQILLNLATNARDAMPGGGTVTVTATAADAEWACLEFSDTGTGMDLETIDRAFEPFFTSKPRGQGTGLGLSTVHGIVTQNGGTLSIESLPELGTTIVIRWPRTAEEVTGDVPSERSPAGEGGSGRVLVVEDNDGARGLIQLILERAGYEVSTEPNAARGLEALQREAWAFDLVLTDVVMPGRSGIELAEDIRALRPGFPILLMSGYLEDGVEAIPGVDPARDLILKPFRAEELRARVREAIAAGPDAEA